MYLFNIVPLAEVYGVHVLVGLFKWHLSFFDQRPETRQKIGNIVRNAIKKSYYRTNIILVCSIDFHIRCTSNTTNTQF